jgi:DNA polymerase/3'-5' exonuclease PolX
MKLEDADRIAEDLMHSLRPACVRCEVGGSVRRRKPVVKDLEIVFIPQIETRMVDMFNSEWAPATDAVIERMVEGRLLVWDLGVKRNGPLYKRLVHVASGLVVELFAAHDNNWGLTWALRTGPGDFNHILVSHAWQGGAMPSDMRMEGGYLWRRGERLETMTEEDFFEALGLPCWKPERRSAAGLTAFLAERNRQARVNRNGRRFRTMA